MVMSFPLPSLARSGVAEPWCRQWIDGCTTCTQAKDGTIACKSISRGCRPGHHCMEIDPVEYAKDCYPRVFPIQCNQCDGTVCTSMACPFEYACIPKSILSKPAHRPNE
jgi:hypothetical protein